MQKTNRGKLKKKMKKKGKSWKKNEKKKECIMNYPQCFWVWGNSEPPHTI
jgi:hypothetical protein